MLPIEGVDLARLLTERFGDVVPDAELPADARPALRPTMAHLRAQVRELGFNLRRVRRQGYSLQAMAR